MPQQTYIRNRLATEPVILKVYNVKLWYLAGTIYVLHTVLLITYYWVHHRLFNTCKY